jgi:hypothetical protein
MALVNSTGSAGIGQVRLGGVIGEVQADGDEFADCRLTGTP